MVCTESGCVNDLGISHQGRCMDRRGRKDGKRTWMLSWRDRQASIVTVSGWLGAHTVERDFPPNIREMGDSTELAYSCPCVRR